MIFTINIPDHRVKSLAKYISVQRIVKPDPETGGQNVEDIYDSPEDLISKEVQKIVVNIVKMFPFGEDRERVIMLKQMVDEMERSTVVQVTMAKTVAPAKAFAPLAPPPSAALPQGDTNAAE